MRHARPDDLAGFESLLESLRALPGLTERSTGTFYKGSVAFLHFHADAAGLFADLKVDGEFVRSRATTKTEQQRLVRDARRELGSPHEPPVWFTLLSPIDSVSPGLGGSSWLNVRRPTHRGGSVCSRSTQAEDAPARQENAKS